MSSFVDVADVKARCSIEQAANSWDYEVKSPKEFHLSNMVTFS